MEIQCAAGHFLSLEYLASPKIFKAVRFSNFKCLVLVSEFDRFMKINYLYI